MGIIGTFLMTGTLSDFYHPSYQAFDALKVEATTEALETNWGVPASWFPNKGTLFPYYSVLVRGLEKKKGKRVPLRDLVLQRWS